MQTHNEVLAGKNDRLQNMEIEVGKLTLSMQLLLIYKVLNHNNTLSYHILTT